MLLFAPNFTINALVTLHTAKAEINWTTSSLQAAKKGNYICLFGGPSV